MSDRVQEWTGWFNVASIAACLFMGVEVIGACITAVSWFGPNISDGSQP